MKLTVTSGKVGCFSPLRFEVWLASNGAHEVPRPTRQKSAFTLVEIALSLAIIGFALVAIIGVLPTGLNVQRDNREETIINLDAGYFIDAIRNGARGLDDLTNYVEAITNIVTRFESDNRTISPGYPRVFGYTYTDYTIDNGLQPPSDVITNGARIVGLLSTPKYNFPKPLLPVPQGFTSNYIIAYVRALSGAAAEKAPQTNTLVGDLAFRYRMIAELVPYTGWSTNWVDTNAPGLTVEEFLSRSNYWQTAIQLQGNLNELRLLFRWPVFANRTAGNGRQSYRVLMGGVLTNEPMRGAPTWFMKSSTYEAAR